MNNCPKKTGKEKFIYLDMWVALKTRWAGVTWHCFAGLRASISGGAVLPG